MNTLHEDYIRAARDRFIEPDSARTSPDPAMPALSDEDLRGMSAKPAWTPLTRARDWVLTQNVCFTKAAPWSGTGAVYGSATIQNAQTRDVWCVGWIEENSVTTPGSMAVRKAAPEGGGWIWLQLQRS